MKNFIPFNCSFNVIFQILFFAQLHSITFSTFCFLHKLLNWMFSCFLFKILNFLDLSKIIEFIKKRPSIFKYTSQFMCKASNWLISPSLPDTVQCLDSSFRTKFDRRRVKSALFNSFTFIFRLLCKFKTFWHIWNVASYPPEGRIENARGLIPSGSRKTFSKSSFIGWTERPI